MARRVIGIATNVVGPTGGWRRRLAVLLSLSVIVSSGLFFARTVLAVHNTGAFELEGNAITETSHDWDEVYADSLTTPHGSTSGAKAISFAAEPDLQATIFTGGGSKDPQDINQWAWKDGAGGLPDKDNLLDSFAARYSLPGTAPNGTCPNGTGDLNGNGVIDGSEVALDLTKPCEVLYFGSDRLDNSGDAQQGFWFLQNEVGLGTNSVGGGFGFTGLHKAGDLLIISDFSNGGATSTITIYRWDPTCTATNKPDGSCGDANLRRLATSTAANCNTAAPGDAFCGIVNAANNTFSPWPFTDKSGFNTFLNGEFYEGGVNLSLLGLAGECFATVASETRSSTSTTATLKDFVLGGFAKCTTGLTTTPKDGSGNDISATDGLSITTAGSTTVKDSATLTISGVASWTGTLKFYLCGPTSLNNAYVPCTSNGTLIDTQTVTNLTTSPILSAAATITSAGKYCWRSEFTSGTSGVPGATDPDPTANPVPTNECFFVNPVLPGIPTQASAGVALGNGVSDTAGLTGTAKEPGSPVITPTIAGGPAAGSITFSLYGPSDTATCTDSGATANLVFTSSAVSVSGDGQYSSGSFTPTKAGTYYWIARYTGDSPNTLSVNGICGGTNETVVVSPLQPSITTDASADPPTGVTLGSAISDQATLSGTAPGAGGTITFKAYGPDDATCSSAPAFTSSPVTVSGDGTYNSGSFTPLAVGTYRWIASYSGDLPNTKAVSGACNDTGEASLVVQLQPTISTAQTFTIKDSATITVGAGGGNLAGSVRFRLYNNATCDTTAPNQLLYDSNTLHPTGIAVGGALSVTVDSDATTIQVSKPVLSWLVEYTSTNAGQKSVASSCNTENASLTITNGS